jgi:phage FluMu gp28-like protein
VADRARVKVVEKSRRVGISWAEAGDDALLAASAKGMDVWYLGYTREMALEFILDCAMWARAYQLAAGAYEECVIEDEDKQILAYRITFASGHRVTALSSRPRNLRNKKGKIVIDEAAFHDDLPGLLKAAPANLMWGGRIAIISTHNGEDNPFNELITEILAGKTPYSLHRVTLDDALAQGLFQRICKTLGEPWSADAEASWRAEMIAIYREDAAEELFVIPSRGSGAYLNRALVESCLEAEIPILRWRCEDDFALQPELLRKLDVEEWCEEALTPILATLDPHQPLAMGEDFARSGDLTAILVLQRQADLIWRAVCLIELRNVPFRQQEQALFFLLDRLPGRWSGAMDARGNGQYLAEVAQQRYGTRIAPVMLSPEWYREQMPRYKAAFEDRALRLPRHSDVVDDHRALKLDKGIAKIPDGAHTQGADGGQRHGDSAIAGALAWFATGLEWGPIEYQPAVRSAWRESREEDDAFDRRHGEAREPATAFGGWRGARHCGW